MKRKLFAIVLTLIVLFNCSCNRKEDDGTSKTTSSVLDDDKIETGIIAGDYIYRTVRGEYNELLLKYHIATGTVSTVCQDPFCTHDSSCPFSLFSENYFTSIGDVLYYAVEEDEQWFLRSYNVDDMKITQIYTNERPISNIASYDYYLFYTVVQSKKDEIYSSITYRYDTKTKEIIEINNPAKYETIVRIENNRILWRKSMSDYYYTDLNGSNRIKANFDNGRQYGNYIYRSVIKQTGSTFNLKLDLYRKNIKSEEEKLIAEDIGIHAFYGDKIIYLKPLPEKILIGEIDWETRCDYFGGNVYIMNLDGSDNRLLCHADKCCLSVPPMYFCGDWVGLDSTNYYEDQYGDDLLLVNIVTGEYKVVPYNPYK